MGRVAGPEQLQFERGGSRIRDFVSGNLLQEQAGPPSSELAWESDRQVAFLGRRRVLEATLAGRGSASQRGAGG